MGCGTSFPAPNLNKEGNEPSTSAPVSPASPNDSPKPRSSSTPDNQTEKTTLAVPENKTSTKEPSFTAITVNLYPEKSRNSQDQGSLPKDYTGLEKFDGQRYSNVKYLQPAGYDRIRPKMIPVRLDSQGYPDRKSAPHREDQRPTSAVSRDSRPTSSVQVRVTSSKGKVVNPQERTGRYKNDRDVPIKRVDSQKILVYLQQPVYYFQNKSTLDTAVRNSYNSPRGSNLVESDYTGYTIASDATFVHATDEKYDYIVNLLPPGQLFEDLEFPANNASLFFDTNDPAASKIVWLRPFEIVGPNERPLFIKEGVSRADIMQGILGDCWFLSSCAAIAKRSKLINKIIPSYQVLYGPKYRGMVHFRFWRYGGWLQVIIDDRLPTEKGKLIYGHCTDPTEFWVPLIEKAYAKLHGTYEALGGGITMDAMVDLTGGLAERYDLAEFDSFLFRRIYRAHKTGAFIACSRKGDWRMATAADENGLVPGHAYTVTNIAMVRHRLGDERLIRVRNPWGDATEWKGSWNDKDVNWQWVDPDTRDNLLEHSSPGEFWMSFRDFFRQFGEVTICLLGPDLDGDGVPEHAGHIEIIRGEWKLGYSAGGSRNNLQKFITNDQYLLTIIEPDDFDSSMDDAESEGRCNVVIALMQQHRKPRRNIKIPNYQIGFFVYETEYRTRKLPLNFFRYNPDYGKTKIFVNYREVSERFEFEPGHYIIIPTTFLEDCPAQFMLRVFGEKRFHLRGPLSRN